MMLEKYYVERVFHPIGQGAFYSEKHWVDVRGQKCNEVNIVYDCGVEYKSRGNTSLNKVITGYFTKEDTIDVLFVSHFDYDHVSKIGVLKDQVKEIKHVVLPLLYDHEKVLILLRNLEILINTRSKKGEEDVILRLIIDPQSYFGEKTKIIYVRPASDQNRREHPPQRQEGEDVPRAITLDYIHEEEVKSGEAITISELMCRGWIFVPFNYQFECNRSKLEDMFCRKGINIKDLLENPRSALEVVMAKRVALSSIYKKLEGGINLNSMFLYSGPNLSGRICRSKYRSILFLDRFKEFWHGYGHAYPRYYLLGCIYTGDGDLNKVNIKSVYADYWDCVRTIQIPHHGSLASFYGGILGRGNYICPMSFGEINSYGHPAPRVVADILQTNSLPIMVTERPSSIYIQMLAYVFD